MEEVAVPVVTRMCQRLARQQGRPRNFPPVSRAVAEVGLAAVQKQGVGVEMGCLMTLLVVRLGPEAVEAFAAVEVVGVPWAVPPGLPHALTAA